MDDAQKRAEQFNTEARIKELEAEIRRLHATLPDRLQAMVTQAEEDGLYEALDVTLDQVRIVELEADNEDLEAEVARLNAALEFRQSELEAALIPVGRVSEALREARWVRTMLTRLFEHQQRHDPDPQCPTCGGVEAYLEGRELTADQQREFDQP